MKDGDMGAATAEAKEGDGVAARGSVDCCEGGCGGAAAAVAENPGSIVANVAQM